MTPARQSFDAPRAVVAAMLPVSAGFVILAPQGLTWFPAVVAGVLALALRAASGAPRLRDLAADHLGVLAMLTAFLLWAWIGLFRSADPAHAVPELGAFCLALAAGAAGTAAARHVGRVGRWHWGFFPLAHAAAALVLALLVTERLHVPQAAGARFAHEWHFNRAAVFVALLLPLSLFALGRMEARRLPRAAMTAALAAGVVWAVLLSESGAAKLALPAVLATWLLARADLRLALGLTGGALAVAVIAAPSMTLLRPLVEGTALWSVEPWTVAERLRIWRGMLPYIEAAPFIGHGIEHVRAAGFIDAANGQIGRPNHPHSALLQVWVDLGFVGALLLTGTLLAALRAIGRLPRASAAMALSILNGAMAVWSVSHGMWQGWFIGLCAVIFIFAAVAHQRAVAEDGGL